MADEGGDTSELGLGLKPANAAELRISSHENPRSSPRFEINEDNDEALNYLGKVYNRWYDSQKETGEKIQAQLLDKDRAESILTKLNSLPAEVRTLLISDISKNIEQLDLAEINQMIIAIEKYEESWTYLSNDNPDGTKTIRIVQKHPEGDEVPGILTRNTSGHPEWQVKNQPVGEKTKTYIEARIRPTPVNNPKTN